MANQNVVDVIENLESAQVYVKLSSDLNKSTIKDKNLQIHLDNIQKELNKISSYMMNKCEFIDE